MGSLPRTPEYTQCAVFPRLPAYRRTAPPGLCTLGGCAPQTHYTLGAALPNPCTWGLHPQTPAVASRLDYNVSSFNIHLYLPMNITIHSPQLFSAAIVARSAPSYGLSFRAPHAKLNPRTPLNTSLRRTLTYGAPYPNQKP